jgi:hypothetical protein
MACIIYCKHRFVRKKRTSRHNLVTEVDPVQRLRIYYLLLVQRLSIDYLLLASARLILVTNMSLMLKSNIFEVPGFIFITCTQIIACSYYCRS